MSQVTDFLEKHPAPFDLAVDMRDGSSVLVDALDVDIAHFRPGQEAEARFVLAAVIAYSQEPGASP